MNKQTKKMIIGIVLIVAIAAVVFFSISSENMTYYQTVPEVLGNPEKFADKKIRIMGLVEKGSEKWEPASTSLGFRITEDGLSFLEVHYIGSKPDMFKEGQGVVVEGAMGTNGVFEASKLLVKHSEEYKVEGKDHQMKKEDYYKSLAN